MLEERGHSRDKFLVGATKRPDGTLDTSQAATWEPSKKVRAGQKEYDDRQTTLRIAREAESQRKLDLRIGPGTAGRVVEMLNQAIRTNEGLKKKNPLEAGKFDLTIQSLESQLGILSTARLYFKREGKNLEEITAPEMYDQVQKMITDWENRLTATPEDRTVEMDGIDGIHTETKYRLTAKLKIARELQQKLCLLQCL